MGQMGRRMGRRMGSERAYGVRARSIISEVKESCCTWAYESQMTLVELSTGARVTMAYHPNNRRVRKEA